MIVRQVAFVARAQKVTESSVMFDRRPLQTKPKHMLPDSRFGRWHGRPIRGDGRGWYRRGRLLSRFRHIGNGTAVPANG